MEIQDKIDILTKGRALVLRMIEGLEIDQINTIPEGFNNNIAWNVAHLVTTQQLLCYKLSGLEMLLPVDFIERNKKGTKPGEYEVSEEEWEQIKEWFVALPNQMLQDYQSNQFKEYTEYETSVGVVLKSIDNAIDFNNFHEGIHLGVIMAQKKLV